MKTKTNNQIPTQKQVESLIADVTAINKRTEPFTVTLSSAERLASLKMRTGGGPVVGTIGQLVEQHKLVLPDISVAGMNSALLLGQRIRPILEAVQQLERRLEDTLIAANSQCWNAATTYYTALARSASTNPTLEASLRPIVAFFAHGPRKKATPGGTPGAPPVASAA